MWRRSERIRLILLVGAAAGLLGLPGLSMAADEPAQASRGFVTTIENPVPASLPFRLTGDVDLTGQKLEGNRNSPNFREYRVIEEGFVANRFRLGLETKDQRWYTEFQGLDIGKDDQNYRISLGSYGRYRFDLEWDETPHLYAQGVRSAFERSEGGVYSFPTALATAVQAAPTTAAKFALLSQLNGSTVFDVKTRNDALRGGFWWSPLPELDVQISYDHTRRAGTRPIGAGFGSPGGQVVELPEPIEWQIDQLNATVGYSTSVWQLQGGYRLSIFGNDIKTMTYGNPICATIAGACATSSNIGRAVLAPDNQAHTFFASGGVNLPMATRIAGKVSYGLNFQNDTFFTHTINPTLVADPHLVLYSPSLRGDLRRLMVDATATSRPIRDVSVTGSYRYYEHDNRTLDQNFPGHVVRDAGGVVIENRDAHAHNYNKQNADLDVDWHVLRPLTLRAGFGWEAWDRNEKREVGRTDEYSGKFGLSYKLLSWLDIMAKYVRSWKRIDDYDPFKHLAHTVLEEDLATAFAASQSPFLRKFDEAARDRHKAEITLRLTPLEGLDVGLTGSYGLDNYPFSYLGLLRDNNWSVGVDAGYTPFSWLTLRANYVREEYHSKQRNRSRGIQNNIVTDTIPSGGLAETTFDWISHNVDVYDTVGAGIILRLIPDKVDLSGDFGYQRSIARVNTGNPVDPQGGVGTAAQQATQRATARAVSFPDDRFSLLRIGTVLRYWVLKNLALRAGYAYERFRVSYWQTDFIQPVNNAPPISGSTTSPLTAAGTTVLDVFLGAKPFKNYEAHIIGGGISYGF